MSQFKELKEYLIGEDGYLFNDNNNGKTIMISGAWGSGKTHFWQKKIEPKFKEKLHDKACVYISLYGKESLKEIKQEAFLKASDEADHLSKEVETFGIDALSSLKDSGVNWAKLIKSLWDLNEARRGQKRGGEEIKKWWLNLF